MKKLRIGLVDVDSHNFPNLPLMKLAAHHRERGDSVEWALSISRYDIVYQSKIFSDTPDAPLPYRAKQIIRGGTGYAGDQPLPDEIEHIYPDYSLYPQYHEAYGFLTRGCPRRCPWCIVADKEGRKSRHVADLGSFWRGQGEIKLLDPNILACRDRIGLLGQLVRSRARIDFTQGLDIRLMDDEAAAMIRAMRVKRLHFAWDDPDADITPAFKRFRAVTGYRDARRLVVYVLTNFNSTPEQDLYRIYKLREIGYDPYVMIFDKKNAPEHAISLQRWVNCRKIWRNVPRFEDYDTKNRAKKTKKRGSPVSRNYPPA